MRLSKERLALKSACRHLAYMPCRVVWCPQWNSNSPPSLARAQICSGDGLSGCSTSSSGSGMSCGSNAVFGWPVPLMVRCTCVDEQRALRPSSLGDCV